MIVMSTWQVFEVVFMPMLRLIVIEKSRNGQRDKNYHTFYVTEAEIKNFLLITLAQIYEKIGVNLLTKSASHL